MYSYFKGEVSAIQPASITFEVNNIGYQIYVANPYKYNEDIKQIFIYQHVKEDELTLYGFETEDDKQMFLDLISVKGIGPKTALAMLATGAADFMRNAIVNEDIIYLQKFPKIGKKAAQQIVIDLAGKYTDLNSKTSVQIQSSNDEDAIEALVALGYKQTEVVKAIKNVDASLTTEQKIKEVLQKMVS